MTTALSALELSPRPSYADLTLVVPTLNEGLNVEAFLREVEASAPGCSILFADDDSKDDTRAVAEAFRGRVRVGVLHRRTQADRGLTASVADGILEAHTEYLVVMDSDLQHPADVLPRIWEELRSGSDLVVAARSDDASFSLRRRIVSRGARRLAARHLRRRAGVSLGDPMSGFFGIRTSVAQAIVREHGRDFERGGFKVLVDLVLHAPADLRIAEVPYVFLPRHAGESKLTRRHYLSFLRQLGRAGRLSAAFLEVLLNGILLRFLLVGLTGVVINEGLLWLLRGWAGAPLILASAVAIEASILWNFAWNDAWTFRGRGADAARVRLGRFHGASAVGMGLNVGVVLLGAVLLPEVSYLLTNLAGIALGSAANFGINLHWTWGVPVDDGAEQVRG